LEVAFQRYASDNLLLTTSTAIQTSQNTDNAFEELATTFDADDGFLQLSDDSPWDATWTGLDVVNEEREATEDVLRRLHDPNAWHNELSAMVESDRSLDRSNAAPEIIEDEHASAMDCATNMILLPATGDTNQSDLALINAFDDALETIVPPRGIEPSLGLHQAMDVEADDSLSANEGARAEPAAPRPEHGANELPTSPSNLPRLREAAAIVGAAAAFALVRRTQTEKRRRSC
jgi:hypothetical protein